MKKVLLSAKDIVKTFNTGNIKNTVINHVNLDIYEGDFTVIMGSSGAGKSTLLYALSGMDKVDSGKIIYGEKDITKLKEKDMASLRTTDFGFVFQGTYLISNLTLFENVAVAGYLKKGISKKEVDEKALSLLQKINIKDAVKRLPAHSSGGEQQRAAIARAVINNPSIIFADEPTGALNKKNSFEVLNLLTELNEDNQSILMVTHDISAAARGNRILYLEDGKIIGEKTLEKFDSSKIHQREEELTKFLGEMKW